MERVIGLGGSALALHELLSIILQSLPAEDGAGDPAIRLLRGTAGSGMGPLRALYRSTAAELCDAGGIAPPAAARVMAALELGRRFAAEPAEIRPRIATAADVFDRFHVRLRDLCMPEFWVLGINLRGDLISETRVGAGSGAAATLRPRDVVRPVLREGARCLILVHHDPDARDDPVPSRQEHVLMATLWDAAHAVGVELWDHVVLGREGYLSFREAGLLPPRAARGAGSARSPRMRRMRAPAPAGGGAGNRATDALHPHTPASSGAGDAELDRMARALGLRAYRLGGDCFEITDGRESRFVSLAAGAGTPCDCPDLGRVGGILEHECIHMLRARLAQGDAWVLQELARLIARLRDRVGRP